MYCLYSGFYFRNICLFLNFKGSETLPIHEYTLSYFHALQLTIFIQQIKFLFKCFFLIPRLLYLFSICFLNLHPSICFCISSKSFKTRLCCVFLKLERNSYYILYFFFLYKFSFSSFEQFLYRLLCRFIAP